VEGELRPGPWGLRKTYATHSVNGEACTDASRTKRGGIVICPAQMPNKSRGHRMLKLIAGNDRAIAVYPRARNWVPLGAGRYATSRRSR
jgi:hypothetical protein